MSNKALRNLAIVGLVASAGLMSADAYSDNQEQFASLASVKILTSNSTDMRWHGVGELEQTTLLCVASTTGRYRLEVVLAGSNSDVKDKPNYTLEFQSQEGLIELLGASQNDLHVFQAETSHLEDCTGGSNAKLVIRYSQQDLLSAVAGSYQEQFRINAFPG